MDDNTDLRRAYEQPGFLASSPVRAGDDDSTSFIVPLRRRRKKTSVEGVATLFMAFMTALIARLETLIAVVALCSLSLNSGASIVLGAA
jgi:hypothetical protein